MQSINRRIREILENSGLTQDEFAKKTSIPKRTLQNILIDGSSVKSDYIASICENFSVSADWLLGYNEKNYVKDDGDKYSVQSIAEDESVRTIAHSDEYYYLPFYNVRASAGDGRLNDETEALPFAFRKYWVKNVLRRSAASLYLIKIEGDSMRPTLVHDDMIMICKDDTIPDDGVFLLRISEALKVKRLTLLPGAKVRVSSDNELFKSYSMPLSEIQIMGRVVWFGRNV